MTPELAEVPEGTLTDDIIIQLAQQGSLIRSGFDPGRVKQACYELRASRTYYDLAHPERPLITEDGQDILIKPRQILVFITEEALDLPSSVLGRVLSKGQLFSLGIVPVNTYADPGFTGRLGIVMVNASNDYLAIPPGEPIAKIEFVRLPAPVSKPYRGQHGYETEIWPIKHQFKLTSEQIKHDPRIGTPVEELSRAYGPDFARLIDRVYRWERRLLVAAAVYFFVLIGIVALAYNRPERVDAVLAVGLGVVSNLAFTLVVWFATNVRRK